MIRARQPSTSIAHRRSLEIGAGDQHRLGAAEREPLAGKRETALGLVVGVGLARLHRPHPQLGVDDHAAPGRAVVVGVRVRVDPQRHTDLWSRKTHAGRGIHRLEHVRDQRADLIRDVFDRGRGGMKDGIAHDANRQNGHALSLAIGIGDYGRNVVWMANDLGA